MMSKLFHVASPWQSAKNPTYVGGGYPPYATKKNTWHQKYPSAGISRNVFLIVLVYQRKSDPVAAPQAESLITDHAGLSSSLVGRPACVLRGETQGRNLSEEQTAARLDDLNPPGLLTMPRSPTSSEDEMAQSFSDYSDDCASDSSREETIYETIRATAEPSPSRMDDIHTNSLVVRVLIPDLQQTKCMRFNPDATVWVAKQRILCTLNQSLKDVLNYGLFQPASNGRDGKFLDEERVLREYPQPISKGVPSLEFRYKSRVYRQPNVDEKQIAKLHTK
ncbi:SH3 and multiple ankyrin repeat domains protein 1, partial [Larimichthys crocea]